MKLETKLFLYGVLFFVPVGLIYAAWSDGEPVGTVGIPLVGGLVGHDRRLLRAPVPPDRRPP